MLQLSGLYGEGRNIQRNEPRSQIRAKKVEPITNDEDLKDAKEQDEAMNSAKVSLALRRPKP